MPFKYQEFLLAEAEKCPTFEDFKKDYLRELKHGLYWHITDNPKFTIDPATGPRDLSSLSDGKPTPGKLMITSHLAHWHDHYGEERPYAALIDMKEVPRKDYYQVNRGFGNEFYVTDISKVKVQEIMPIEKALTVNAQYQINLPNNDRELLNVWESVHKIKGNYMTFINKIKASYKIKAH